MPGSPERELYISGTVLTPNGSTPPDNWPAMFGAGAWERASNLDGSPGQWYLHLFAPEQPDWNWKNQVCARSHWFTSRGMIMDLSCSKYSGSRRRRREGKKRNSIRSSKDRRLEGRETRIVENPLSLTVRSTQTVK